MITNLTNWSVHFRLKEKTVKEEVENFVFTSGEWENWKRWQISTCCPDAQVMLIWISGFLYLAKMILENVTMYKLESHCYMDGINGLIYLSAEMDLYIFLLPFFSFFVMAYMPKES